MNKIIKGLLMTILVFVATFFQTNGIPATIIQWDVLGIITLGTVIGYIAQSYIIPSTSTAGSLNWLDLLKGGLVALSNFLATWGATAYAGISIDLKSLFSSIVAILVGYTIKQVTQQGTNIIKT